MKSKQILSILLAGILSLSIISTPVFAEEINISDNELVEEICVDTDNEYTNSISDESIEIKENKTIENTIESEPIIPSESDEIIIKNSSEICVLEKPHTEQEIREYLKNHPVDFNEKITLAETPKTIAPYAPGRLSDKTLNSALTLTNNIRYMTGLNPIGLNEELTKLAQAASLVDGVNNVLTHYPTKPSDMDEDLYQLGYEGASNSNLGMSSFDNTVQFLIMYYMDDSDESNISKVGHRMHVLNPFLKQTGFGYVENNRRHGYTAMHVFDIHGDDSWPSHISWPAQEMPLEYFNPSVAWSILINDTPEQIQLIQREAINIKLTRESDGKTWNFNDKSESSDGYFNTYGCVFIFRPNDIGYSDGDRFHIEITGIPNKTVQYDVHFFDTADKNTVSFKTNGGTEIAPISVTKDSRIQLPENPTKEGFYFGGWFTDPELTKPFDATKPITEDMTLYAAWREAPTYIIGQSVNIKSQYFSTLSDISKYKVILTDTGEDASKYATVSNKGILSAKKAGNITVIPQEWDPADKQYYDYADAAIQITILPKPVIKFVSTLSYTGQSINIYDCFADNWADYGIKPIKLTSSNTRIASIDSDGNIIAGEANGTATITAIFSEKNKDFSTNSLKITAKLTVKHPKFAKIQYVMLTGQQLAVPMTNVNGQTDVAWSSSNSNKLEVVSQLNSKGAKTGKVLLTAKECGEFTLTASIDSQDYTCTIIVKEPAIKKAAIKIKVNRQTTVGLKNTKYKANQIEWHSEDETIATVNSKGIVKGITAGAVKIYTETGGIRNECTITVY